MTRRNGTNQPGDQVRDEKAYATYRAFANLKCETWRDILLADVAHALASEDDETLAYRLSILGFTVQDWQDDLADSGVVVDG